MKLDELRNQIDEIDIEMAKLFEKRMKLVREVGDYKKEHHLPILDSSREKEVIEKNSRYIENESLIPLYQEFLVSLMNISKKNEK